MQITKPIKHKATTPTLLTQMIHAQADFCLFRSLWESHKIP